MHIFFSVGEPSGDQHAAHLMAELRRRDPAVRCSGFGGPLMEAQGLESLHRLTDLAVMGFGDVLPLLKTFRGLKRQAEEFLSREKPDICLLIDYPGFNWHIAKAAKRQGIRVVYYCPPQLWAWGTWRLRKLKKSVDQVLSVLPFEAEWYRQRGVNVAMVGHPFFDEIAEKSLDSEACRQLCASAEQRVALLPGSRDAEVRRNFPVMVEAARQLEKKHPHVRFHVACFKERHREQCRQVLDEQPAPLPVELHCGRTSEILETATCVLMVSGSVSLEVLMRRKPAVVIYRGTLFLGVMGLFFIHCKYMSLPNLMVDRMLLPEIPFVFRPRKQARRAAGLLDGWLSAPAERERVEQELHELQQAAGTRGGVVRAVDALLAGQARQPSARAA